MQHHPARADLLPGLLDRFTGVPVSVIEDPDPGAKLRSAWRTYRECVRAAPVASHVLIVQDDILPCADFQETLLAVANEHPSTLVSLFLPGALGLVAKLATREAARGERYVTLDHGPWVPTVALLWPASLLEAFAKVAPGWAKPNQISDDALVGKFRREHPAKAVATVPSLVQHPDVTVSIVRNRPAPSGMNRMRTAHQWRGEEWSPVASGWAPSDACGYPLVQNST